jgi:Zn-dependent protease with chaperone function
MNFFENQDRARQKTNQLLALFAASVLTLIIGVYFATIACFTAIAPSLLFGGCVVGSNSDRAPVAMAKNEAIALIAWNGPLISSDAAPQLIAKSSSGGSSSSRSSSSSGSRSSSSSSSSNSNRNTIGNRRSRSSQPTANFDSSRRSDTHRYSSYGGNYSQNRYSQNRYSQNRHPDCGGATWFQPHIFLGVAIVILGVILGASAFKIAQLRSGGRVIAEELGGHLVTATTNDVQESMLLNVVEEMAIASGIAVPQVYLMDTEHGINAFAAGFTPNDAVIGVTRGSLMQLNRDELQGVIGHEFSHILNGDMRLNIQLMGWLHGILCIYLIGRGIVNISGTNSRDRDANGLTAFGIALIVLGGSGLLFGRLMQSAISRQREYLADASAVQFTRNPDGIASALEKIGGVGSKLNASYAQAASHMFFGSVLSSWWSGDWFATHPPVRQRVAQIRGVQVGNIAESMSATTTATLKATATKTVRTGVAGFSSAANSTHTPTNSPTNSPTPGSINANPDRVITHIGTVVPEQYRQTQSLLAKIPPELRSALRDPQGAALMIYALMLDRTNPQIYQQQMGLLQQFESAAVIKQASQFQSHIQLLDPRLYLPLVDLAIPALRQTSAIDCQRLLKAVHALAKADGQWTLAEFVTYLVLQYRLQPHFNHATATQDLTQDLTQAQNQDLTQAQNLTQVQYTTIAPVWDDCVNLIAALAQAGSDHSENVTYAFRSGLFRLPNASQQTIPNHAPPANLGHVRQGLERLRQVTPKLKQAIVDACAYTVMIDQTITLPEADLLRAIVILLDCPIPPFLNADLGK